MAEISLSDQGYWILIALAEPGDSNVATCAVISEFTLSEPNTAQFASDLHQLLCIFGWDMCTWSGNDLRCHAGWDYSV